MNEESLVRWIGISHLLQPPLAFLLTRRLGLQRVFSGCPPLAGQLARNMAVASIGLPTAMGALLALHAHEVAAGQAARSMAWLAAGFWSWRLQRQWHSARLWHDASPIIRRWHRLLSLIFLVQGPYWDLFLRSARREALDSARVSCAKIV